MNETSGPGATATGATRRKGAEAALHESEERLKLIINATPAGIGYFDKEQRFQFANDKYESLVGLTPSEIVGKTLREVLGKKAYKVAGQYVQRALNGETVDFENTLPAKDGGKISIAVSYVPDMGPDGTVNGFFALVQDITEHKHAEAALQKAHDELEFHANRELEHEIAERRRTQDLYETVLYAAPDPIVIVDRDGKFVVVNSQVERVFGYGSEELIGQSVEILLPEHLRDRHVGHRNDYLGDPQVRPMGVGLELVARCKDGRELPVEISLSPVQSTEGALVTAVIRDISERKEAELVLRDHQEHLRLLLETTPAIPWEREAKTWKCTYVGPQAVELLGYPRERWLEKDFWADHLHPEDRAGAVDHGRKSVNRGENYEFEYRMIAADGRSVWLQDIVTIVKQDGVPVGFRGFMIDITERKSLEELQRDLSARLISAHEEERMKISRELHDDFGQRLALLAFEIQQLGQKISEPEFEGAGSIDKLWSRTHDISTDLHRLSRQLHPAMLDQLGLGPAVRSLCSEISQQHGIEINITEHEVPESISPDIALCLYRTVQEGLRNIVKHSGAKDADVELTGGPDTIHLRIVDRGVGFDPATTKRKGLGLVSIGERVQLVRGEMSLQSQPAHGTSIDLTIPLVTPDA